MLEQKILGCTRKAIDDYHMIRAGDKIAVGVSGGKDSGALLWTLRMLQKFYLLPFELVGITIDMGFDGCDFSDIARMCQTHDISYVVEQTNIAKVVFDIRKEKNPCSLCANMRRGALHAKAKELGCNKIALGHHRDDVIETFLMCLFHEAHIHCFSPVTYLDRMDLHMIRPFIYVPESEIVTLTARAEIPVVHNPCPANGNTQRQYTKDLIKTLEKDKKNIKQMLFSAIKNSTIQGWDRDVTSN